MFCLGFSINHNSNIPMVNINDPFSAYKISDNWIQLQNISERTPCTRCKRSRKFFCYTCLLPVHTVKDFLPEIRLPIHIDILKHKREIDGKSTAVHAVLLAPNNVSILQYPEDIYNYAVDDKAILIYPGENALTLEEYFKTNPIRILKNSGSETLEEGSVMINGNIMELPFRKAIFVDGTWNQSKAMYGCLKNLPCIVLQSRMSQFWRHQKNSPRWYLATIEAIHQLISEINEHCCKIIQYNNVPQTHDNLLFFFRYMYHLIHLYYDNNELKAFRRPINL